MYGAMNAVLYPVAANAEAALTRPIGKAARERQAKDLAGRDVEFISEEVGPAFESAEAAEAAYAAVLEGGAVRVREVVAKVKGRVPVVAPVKPQQPLDVGLFEYRLPEAPEIVIPDE